MADLTSYIRKLIKQGYDTRYIKQYLRKYGYPEKTIDQALYNVQGHRSTLPLSLASTIILIIIVVAISAFALFWFWPDASSDSLEMRIMDLDSTVKAGASVQASIDLSKDSKQDEDIFLKAEVFDRNDKRVAFRSQTAAVGNSDTVSLSIKLPNSLQEGSYTLTITARYSGQSPQASKKFSVTSDKQPTCSDGIKNQDEEDIDCGGSCKACKDCPASCEDDNANTQDYCNAETDFECKHDPISVCGDSICSKDESTESCSQDCQEQTTANPWDELERIKQLAKTDKNQAKVECSKLPESFRDKCLENIGEESSDPAVCDKITEQYNRDRCFTQVAQSLNNQAICENIQKESRRDNCYINFAIDGDYTVCDKIINTYLKKSCTTLAQTSG
ncbi:hypothetical protein GOV09_03930 [Candidatus Woesearchaeota archaeon]|nr:hypothetical protein [Candidatus Woesearchaeota archaeon]